MRLPLSAGVVLSVFVTMLVAAASPVAQAPRLYGGTSPEDVVATINRAAAKNDFLAALPVFSPNSLKDIANEVVSGVLFMVIISNPDDGMPSLSKPTKSELESQRKKYATVLDLVTKTLKPHGLDVFIGKPVLSPEMQKSIDAVLAKTDNVVLITSLVDAMNKVGPLLGLKPSAKPQQLMTLGTVTGYKITGDTATAKNGQETMDFVRLSGRWYAEMPASPGSARGNSASSAASPSASGAEMPRATASGSQPEVVVGGLQVAKVAVSRAESSARPFHSENGAQIALWIKMPVGQGLIEIDENASLLQHFGDDKGTDLGGHFDSFAQEFKDGSGGLITITSTAIPAAGAVALVAEGSVSIRVATGTSKTRTPSIKLLNDQKFTLGAASITVTEVETQGENQTFTLKLSPQVMAGIKDVAFFDERGATLEGHRTMTSYMGSTAEMSLTVKTSAKVLTLEFETWLGQRTIKVPFKVRAGFGFN